MAAEVDGLQEAQAAGAAADFQAAAAHSAAEDRVVHGKCNEPSSYGVRFRQAKRGSTIS